MKRPRGHATLVDTLRDKAFAESFDDASTGKAVEAALPETLIESARAGVPDAEARSWVVTLGPITTPANAGPIATGTASGAGVRLQSFIADSHAVVTWGQQGSDQFALIDWIQGQQFSVHGSYVRVFGVSEAFIPIPGFDANTRYSAHISPGLVSRSPVRTVLYPGPIAAAGGTAIAGIPAYAESFNVFREDLAGGVGPMDIRMRRGLGDGVTLGGVMFTVTQATSAAMIDHASQIMLPMGATALEVENTDPVTAIDQLAIRYKLAL